MPAKNYRGRADRLLVTAAAARVAGQVVVEEKFPGIAMVDAAPGAKYEIHLEGEFELALAANAVKGGAVYVNVNTFAITAVAFGAAAPSGGTVLLGRITGVPNNGVDANNAEPKAGKMYVRLVGPVNNTAATV